MRLPAILALAALGGALPGCGTSEGETFSPREAAAIARQLVVDLCEFKPLASPAAQNRIIQHRAECLKEFMNFVPFTYSVWDVRAKVAQCMEIKGYSADCNLP